VKLFAKAVLVIPKVLVTNAGHDAQEMILKAMQGRGGGDSIVGLDLDTGDLLYPTAAGIMDNYSVKKQIIDARYEFAFMPQSNFQPLMILIIILILAFFF